MMKFIPHGLSREQQDRLLKLADIIEKVPIQQFDMASYVKHPQMSLTNLEARILRGLHPCGTVGCIAGHAMIHRKELGLSVKTLKSKLWGSDLDWYKFISQLIGTSTDLHTLHNWLLDCDWVYVDNDPVNSAKRIRYTVKNGIPENWRRQLYHGASRSYL